MPAFARLSAAAPALSLAALLILPTGAGAQVVDDGSDSVIGAKDTRAVLALVERHLDRPDAKITALRRSEGAVICGSVNVKNRDGLYIGERGFVADLSDGFFGRVPEGPELLMSHRAPGYEAMERIRQMYFRFCLD